MTPRDEAIEWARRMLALGPDLRVLDTETTGLGADAEICDVAVIDGTGKVLLNTLVNPEVPIPLEASRIHGITNELVLAAPKLREIHAALSDATDLRTVVIYNADYDTGVLFRACNRRGLSHLCFQDECAMLAYAKYVGQWDRYRRAYKWQKLPPAPFVADGSIGVPAHRALADCLSTLHLLRVMAGEIDNETTTQNTTTTTTTTGEQQWKQT